MDRYHVSDCGSIVDQYGAILYEEFAISDLGPAARRRLAELHTVDEELEWEGDGTRLGAWDILINEGLMLPVL